MGERGLRGRGLPTIAVAAALGLLSSSQTIALAEGCYYGTSLLFRELERWGLRFVEFDQTQPPPAQ